MENGTRVLKERPQANPGLTPASTENGVPGIHVNRQSAVTVQLFLNDI